MSSLSPLVVHGKLLWESIVALACVAGIVAAWLLPRRALRRRADAIRAGLGEATSSLAPSSAEKLVVVSGKVVRASGSPDTKLAAATLVPAAMAFAEEGSKRAHTATAAGEPLVLEVGGAHVALHGSVQILVGSRESGKGIARRRAHRALDDLASRLEDTMADGLALRTLRAGDLVRAQGILRHTPSETGAASYRVAASAYTLSPGEDGTHPGIVPVAFEGAPAPLEPSRPELVGRVLAFPALAFVALAAVGELAMHSAPSSPAAASLAAATPLRRFDALAALRAQTSLSASPTDATLRDQASLDTLRGFYGMASDDYALANRPDEAARIAAHYGDPFRVARARFVNGEIAESAKAFARARARDPKLPITISEVTAYVLTDDFEHAATGAHSLLATWDGPKGSQDDLQCIVDAIDHRAGGSHDKGALERHAREGATRVPCSLLMLDLRDGTGGASGDDTLSELRSDPRVRRYLEPLTHGRFDGCAFPASDILGCWSANDAIGPGMITDPKASAFYLPQALALEAFQHTRSEVFRYGWPGEDMALAASLYAAARTFLGDVESALTILDVADRALAPHWRRAEEEAATISRGHEDGPFRRYDNLSSDLARLRSTRAGVLLRRGRARDALRLKPLEMGARFSTLAHVMGAYDPIEQRELA